MKKILIATRNEGKKKEMLEVLKKIPNIQFLSLRDFSCISEPEEIEKTFEGNALLKAKFCAQNFHIPAIGEDSGLRVAAFPKKFGIRTRRELPAADDTEWLRLFLEMMDGVADRRATFFSAMGFFDPEKKIEHTVLGSCTGTITEFPQTALEPGIPVSAVFIPNGHTLVYSAMSKHEKNSVSHRGKAAMQMMEFLKNTMAN